MQFYGEGISTDQTCQKWLRKLHAISQINDVPCFGRTIDIDSD